MTQRNFQNARNQGDGPKGKSKKSASSAKLKSKAGASVYAPSKEAKAKRAKQEAKARKNQPVEAKARNLTKTERRELDDAIAASIERDQQRRAERKSKMPWGKKKPQESAEDSPSDQ